MPDNVTTSLRRGGTRLRLVAALLAALIGLVFVGVAASAPARAAEPKVPEDVAEYFANGLIPRLADLYGTSADSDPSTTFDKTTNVGTIQRLLEWTPEFLAGQKSDPPTQLTNTWVAPVTAKSGTILGLAAVWINPGNNKVELADFSRGRALVDALGRAPKDTKLINDTQHGAWFATDGKTLTPLVVGASGTRGPLTPAEYQQILKKQAGATEEAEAPANPGLMIAGVTLGAVVLLLAVFILLPGRKRRAEREKRDAVHNPRRNLRQPGEREFDRTVTQTEARAKSSARSAVNAEAALVDAMAASRARAADDARSARDSREGGGPAARLAAVPSGTPDAETPPVEALPAETPATLETSTGKTAADKPAADEPTADELESKGPPMKKPAATPAKTPAAKKPTTSTPPAKKKPPAKKPAATKAGTKATAAKAGDKKTPASTSTAGSKPQKKTQAKNPPGQERPAEGE